MTQAPVEVLSSLETIDPREWDALAGDSVLASYGWVRAIHEEALGNIEPRYLIAREGGRLAGAAACYVCRRGARHFAPDHLMFGRSRHALARLGLSFLPAMILGPVRSYGKPLLLDESLDPATRERLRRALMEAVAALARDERLSLHLPNVHDECSEETLRLLEERGFHRTLQFPVLHLDLEWDSFDGYLDYLGSFSRNMPRNVLKEMRRLDKAGIVLRTIDDPSVHGPRLHELADGHYRRLNNNLSWPYSPRFLTRLKEGMGDDVVFYGAFRDAELVGFSMMLRRGGIAYAPLVGIDDQKTHREGLYFCISYYRPIADAIAQRLRRLYVGKTPYHAKIRRGFRGMPMYLFYRSASRAKHEAMRPWFAFHAAWMRRKTAPLLDVAEQRRFRGE